MSDISDKPSNARDEAQTFDHATEIGCPYLWLDGGRYRSLDQCMKPDSCDCWRTIQLERMPPEDRPFHATAADLNTLARFLSTKTKQ